MFPVTVADYISRAESQSRQNLPQKENHAVPEPKVHRTSQVQLGLDAYIGQPILSDKFVSLAAKVPPIKH